MALSTLGVRRIRFVEDGLQLLTGHFLDNVEGISEATYTEALEWASYRLRHHSLPTLVPADVESGAYAMVDKLKVHGRGANAQYLASLFQRMFTPEMRSILDSQFAVDVPHALARVFLLLSCRPADAPHDFSERLVERRVSCSYISTGEISVSSYSASIWSESASWSESDLSSASDSKSGVKIEEWLEPAVECVMESVPLPVYFHELKRGHRTKAPEEFVVEDVVALLLGLDNNISLFSSISTLHDETLSGVIANFEASARCLGELRALSEALRLVLPPIEDYTACQYVTELWQRGEVCMEKLVALPHSGEIGLVGSQPVFGPCWHGVRDEVDAQLCDFDESLSLPEPHRSLIFLWEKIRPRIRVFQRINRLISDVFAHRCADSEEMRLLLITKLTQSIVANESMIPMWKQVMRPLYDALARSHAFNLPTGGVLDCAPLPIGLCSTGNGPDMDASHRQCADEALRIIADMPSACALSRIAAPLRTLSLNASRKQASAWLAPNGPLRVALACFHAVALWWSTPVLQYTISQICLSNCTVNVALGKSIANVLHDDALGSVLDVPISTALECASKYLTATGSLNHVLPAGTVRTGDPGSLNHGDSGVGTVRLRWTGDPSFTIFDSNALLQYGRVMELLLVLSWTLSIVPRSVPCDPLFRANGCILCAEMRHFLLSLRQYLALSIEEASNKLKSQLAHIANGSADGESMKLIAVAHEQFLRDTLEGCLLLPEFESVMDNIFAVMRMIREFSTSQTDIENMTSDFRMRMAFIIKALKWSVGARGLRSSNRVVNLGRTVNFNNFYVDM